MSVDKGCTRCGNRAGHDEMADARCAYRVGSTAVIRHEAAELGADPVATADLLAHLRSTFTDDQAHRAALTVLDLGWRKTVPVADSSEES